ncbi:hypothetical protein E2C01_026273 [Portunus trituberculatus]|uniref:Uncharacterized protein n=1 Tax=Portunus trituberculatus TaxID=210409 RepID=A0A5B7EI71_PORTR|nr:hypothetical protein [Portunus trituberculatus]
MLLPRLIQHSETRIAKGSLTPNTNTLCPPVHTITHGSLNTKEPTCRPPRFTLSFSSSSFSSSIIICNSIYPEYTNTCFTAHYPPFGKSVDILGVNQRSDTY